MSSNYFYKIKESYQNINAVKKFIPTAEWQWFPYVTVASNFYESIEVDPFIKDVTSQFTGTLKLYKFPAKQVYHWHKDANIGCSLNMVFREYNSHTLFTHPERDNKHVEPIIELKYEPETWYIFNSQENHTVINLDDQDRILFTLIMPKGINYHDVVNWYKEHSKK